VTVAFLQDSVYLGFVSSRPTNSAKNGSDEYLVFESALKKVLSVSHSEIKSKLHAKKRKRTKR
jgi:hypothetical protein